MRRNENEICLEPAGRRFYVSEVGGTPVLREVLKWILKTALNPLVPRVAVLEKLYTLWVALVLVAVIAAGFGISFSLLTHTFCDQRSERVRGNDGRDLG